MTTTTIAVGRDDIIQTINTVSKYLVARSYWRLHVIRKWLVSRILLCLFKLLWSYWINANAIYSRRCANRFPIESSARMMTSGGGIHGLRLWKHTNTKTKITLHWRCCQQNVSAATAMFGNNTIKMCSQMRGTVDPHSIQTWTTNKKENM